MRAGARRGISSIMGRQHGAGPCEKTMIDTNLLLDNGSRILLLVLDGLGGLPTPGGELTELETARTPNLDSLAAEETCGLHTPCGPGLTPGSGPGPRTTVAAATSEELVWRIPRSQTPSTRSPTSWS